jgi:hypothetical protein
MPNSNTICGNVLEELERRECSEETSIHFRIKAQIYTK